MYRVNEIFYSLQGEGFWTGTPMVFLRLSGCNLRCPFCDTSHSEFRLMTADDIVARIRELGKDCTRVCITGGEPALQLDDELVDALHLHYYTIHLETNGTRPIPRGVDWVTMSPKEDVPHIGPDARIVLPEANELKLVFDGSMSEERLTRWAQFPAKWHFLQPCDTGEAAGNARVTAAAVEYVKEHPEQWRLSLQTHKLLAIR